MGLEFHEKRVMEEGGLISVLKGGYVWVIHNFSIIVCITTPAWLEAKME